MSLLLFQKVCNSMMLRHSELIQIYRASYLRAFFFLFKGSVAAEDLAVAFCRYHVYCLLHKATSNVHFLERESQCQSYDVLSFGKFRRETFFEDFDEHPERIFQATFGTRWYTWSFRLWEESSFQRSTPGSDWREHSNCTSSRSKEWDSTSGTESEDESCTVGSCSERTILGLPPNGPLKIEDVKNAFRLSALKWHPDKHQGPSQDMAEEKFKHCVNAYKSLCNALSTATSRFSF
ncbi:unnamed protein product [Ilex paraguariensis]|uniref:J domain-containing protein n=1 Tax=Ilex paraguariensis TaxID=185542 RepID=A0ABC8QLP4_9AQUA